jgi:CheY-like chemotaxis protein
MKLPLRVLHIDDNPVDVRLAQAFLAVSGIACDVVRVDTAPALEDVLQSGGFDCVLSDFVLPVVDGLQALSLVQRLCPASRSLSYWNDQRQSSRPDSDVRSHDLRERTP